MITDQDVNFFLEENFEGIKDNLDPEIVRDILTLSKLYDKNYQRVQQAVNDGNKERHRQLLQIEDKLNSAGNLLRDLIGIRARDPEAKRIPKKK